MQPDRTQPKVVFDSHHPKHYLTVRRLAQRCADRGIEVFWTARKKDVLVDLMRQDGNEPFVLTEERDGIAGKLAELALYDWRLARLVRRLRPFALMGKAISLAHVGRLLRIPSLLINDDSAEANPQYRYLGYPFADRILTAECLGESYGPRQRTYPGLMELAYLHPNAFAPDARIRDELGVDAATRVFVIRLAALKAYHDAGERGLSPDTVDQILRILAPLGRVFIVSESSLPPALADYRLPCAASRLHHVLAIADVVVGDGLTVPVEAALLGRPAVVFGSYVSKNAYVRTLQRDFGLIYGFKPGEEAECLDRVRHLSSGPAVLQDWAQRRAAMLSVWSDPTDVYWEELLAVYRRAYPALDPLQAAVPDGV